MMTLKELKNEVMVAEVENRVPTPKALETNSKAVVREIFPNGAEISVYQNGFVHYKAEAGETVFPLHGCEAYEYDSVTDQKEQVADDVFENEAWYLRLILEGEDRIASNNKRKHEKSCVSYSQESEDWSVMKAKDPDLIDQVINHDMWELVADQVNKKQWESFYDVYVNGATYRDIAKRLGISRQAATRLVERTMKRIRTALENAGFNE